MGWVKLHKNIRVRPEEVVLVVDADVLVDFNNNRYLATEILMRNATKTIVVQEPYDAVVRKLIYSKHLPGLEHGQWRFHPASRYCSNRWELWK